MEWVETTGRTVEDAKEAALDELGVDESDAEFEVLEEARSGLFGRLRSEARIRARVRPTAPRSKEDRRDRRRRGRGDSAPSGAGSDAAAGRTAAGAGSADVATATEEAAIQDQSETRAGGPRNGARSGSGGGRNRQRAGAGSEGRRSGSTRDDRSDRNGNDRREGNDVEVALEEQGRIAKEFLTQLTAEFGVDATIDVVQPDEDTVDLDLKGSDLGLLIGQKGATLLAIQDLTRTVVHHRTGAGNGRIHVDVGGYRQKRAEALGRFAEEVAATVKQTGTRTVMEPMTAADRKVVHDAITSIEGVSTVSEGEEPRRRVVVLPSDS